MAKRELYEHLVLRDFPGARRVYGVDKDGELHLDHADGAGDNESFYDFAADTLTAAALSWRTADDEPAVGDRPQTRGGWEKFQDPNLWVHALDF